VVKGQTTFTFVTGGIESAITQWGSATATINAALAGLALIALFGWHATVRGSAMIDVPLLYCRRAQLAAVGRAVRLADPDSPLLPTGERGTAELRGLLGCCAHAVEDQVEVAVAKAAVDLGAEPAGQRPRQADDQQISTIQRIAGLLGTRAGLRVAAACLAAEPCRVSASATAPARVVAAELGAIPRAPHSNATPAGISPEIVLKLVADERCDLPMVYR
jgi:hypothetical protein